MNVAETIAAITGRPVVPGDLPDDYCAEHDRDHRCCACDDAGRLQTVRLTYSRGFTSPQQFVPCPECSSSEGWDPRIPGKYALKRITEFEPASSPARGAVTAYVATWPPPSPGMVMIGPPGRGKTHLACAALYAAYEAHGVRGRFYKVPDLLARIRATFNNGSAARGDDAEGRETMEGIIAEVLRVPFLVLDDLGAEKGSEWVGEQVYRLVDARYSALMPTIYTLNPDGPGWAAMHPRIKSRLLDRTEGQVIEFTGPDWRLQG